MPDEVVLCVNGKQVRVARGTSVAAAVFMAGETAFRHSVTEEPRAPVCGMGICFECRVEIDSQPHQRSCLVPARDGMMVRTT